MAGPVEQRTYSPNLSAVPFHQSPARVKALCGPVGSGKSTVACMEFFLLCHESPVSIRGLVLRETYRQLADSTRRTWEEWFGHCSRYVKQDERIELTIPGVDGVVRTHYLDFRHARRVEEATNFLSTEYACIWLEEPVPAFDVGKGIVGGGIPEGVFDIALMRQRQSGAHRLHILLTFNPPNKYHWIYKRFFEPTPEELESYGFALFTQPARENKANLPAGYYETLTRVLDPVLAERFVEGRPVTMYPGVRVYPDAIDGVHVVDDLDPVSDVPLVTGHDWGLTPVAIFAQVLPSGRIHVFRELQLWNASVSKLIEQMKRLFVTDLRDYKISRSWGDPAGSARAETDESTCFALMADAGFPVAPGAITFQERREATTQLFRRMVDGKPAILVSRRGCPILSEGLLGGYRYPQSRDGIVHYNPSKNEFSHSCNALEYLITGEFSMYSGEARNLKSSQNKKPSWRDFNPLDPGRGGRRGTWMSK